MAGRIVSCQFDSHTTPTPVPVRPEVIWTSVHGSGTPRLSFGLGPSHPRTPSGSWLDTSHRPPRTYPGTKTRRVSGPNPMGLNLGSCAPWTRSVTSGVRSRGSERRVLGPLLPEGVVSHPRGYGSRSWLPGPPGATLYKTQTDPVGGGDTSGVTIPSLSRRTQVRGVLLVRFGTRTVGTPPSMTDDTDPGSPRPLGLRHRPHPVRDRPVYSWTPPDDGPSPVRRHHSGKTVTVSRPTKTRDSVATTTPTSLPRTEGAPPTRLAVLS